MNTIVVTDAKPEDVASAWRFAIDTAMFDHPGADELKQHLLAVIQGHGPGAVLTARQRTDIVGAGYFEPEPFSDRCWNLYCLVVDKDRHGVGIGSRIVDEVERRLRDLGPDQARVLLIETSSMEQYRNTRAFYTARGYDLEARVRDYYGPGDDKIIFGSNCRPELAGSRGD